MVSKNFLVAGLVAVMVIALVWYTYSLDQQWQEWADQTVQEHEAQLKAAKVILEEAEAAQEREFYRGIHAQCVYFAQFLAKMPPSKGLPLCISMTQDAYNQDAYDAAHEVDKYQYFQWPLRKQGPSIAPNLVPRQQEKPAAPEDSSGQQL